MEISSELEQHIQKCDENRNYSQFTPKERLAGEKEQKFFISKFPRSEIRNIKMLDYVQGKRVNGNPDPETFSTLIEFGSKNFGRIGGGSAKKHGMYMRVQTQKLDYNPKFASPDAAYDAIINLIADCINHAENFIKTKDWKKFSDIITQIAESQTGTPSIPVISKIIAMYYPDEFPRIWSHQWLNKILDLFQVNRNDLPEGGKEGRFYEKMHRVVEAKNSHPIMKEWSNKYFSYTIGEYLEQKKSEKSESTLLKFLKSEMKMQANYQPIVIKMLLESNSSKISTSTIKQAAITILQQNGKPLHYREITERAVDQKLIGTSGQTPELSLLRDMTEDIRLNPKNAIFKKVDEGIYGLNDYTLKSEFTVTVKEIREKFGELNFGRMSYTKASGRPGGNDAISSVKGALKKFVKFPEGTSQGNATLNDGVVNSAEIPECLKICGQEIARWHIENIVQDDYQVWDILPGKEEDGWKYLDDFLKLNCIGAGWNQIKDLEKLPTKDDALKYIREHHPELVNKQSATTISHDIKQKDIVVLSKGQSEIIDFGIVTGDYNYNLDAEPHEKCAHTRGVVWLRRGNIKKEDFPDGLMEGVASTANHILGKKQEMMNILFGKPYQMKTTIDRSIMEENYSEDSRIIQVLKRKMNIVLYGPPGTGKTYNAKKIAEKLISTNTPDAALCFPTDQGIDKITRFQKFLKDQDNKLVWGVGWLGAGQLNAADFPINGFIYYRQEIIAIARITKITSHDETTKEEQKLRPDNQEWKFYLHMDKLELCKPFSHKKLKLIDKTKPMPEVVQQRVYVEDYTKFRNQVTFHQSYGYEEFIEGIRPKSTKNGGITYPVEPGTFKKICDTARGSQNKFVLIIDEINRGNISKIFGELITIIENDKRGEPVILAYSGDSFSVPENVYVIGTMNTADQSIKFLDAALKRRFSSIELMPDPSILKDGMPGLSQLLIEINKRIVEKRTRDNQIGHSYFMNKEKAITDIEELQFVFATEIIPLLRDYFYDNEDDLQHVLGEQFIDWDEGSANVKDDWQNDKNKFRDAIKAAYNVKI